MAITRIFQIAKELNISHTDIISFLDKKGVDIKSHMSPVDDDVKDLIMSEFSKDKKLVDRFRKEQVRKEIHDTRLKEKQESQKKLKLLSLKEQREIEKTEKIKREKENIDLKKNLAEVPEVKIQKRDRSSKSVTEIKKKYNAPKKQKLRKINLSNIQSEIGQPITTKPNKNTKSETKKTSKNIETKVKATLAAIGKKKKKKTYKKIKAKEDIDENEIELK